LKRKAGRQVSYLIHATVYSLERCSKCRKE
jgi:hypothetical protein